MTAHAQQPIPPSGPVAPDIEQVFGIGDNEFLIGGWNIPPPPSSTSLDDRWEQSLTWARNIGANVFRLHANYAWIGTNPNPYDTVHALLDRADQSDTFRFFLAHIEGANNAAYGLEAKFYLVPDSVPFKAWPCKFRYLNGGITTTNTEEVDDWLSGAKQRRYDRNDVSANTTIADSIVLDWRPERTSWWSQVQTAGNWCRVPEPLQQRVPGRLLGEFWSDFDKGNGDWADENFVVVTGHLDEQQLSASDTSTILWIDIFYDIGRGDSIHDPSPPPGSTSQAPTNLSVYCTTFAVRQQHLRPSGTQTWNKYQSVSLPFDATVCNADTAGPLHPLQGDSRRINIRVRYAGNATVSLRSIALRDFKANEVLSGGQWGFHPGIFERLAISGR